MVTHQAHQLLIKEVFVQLFDSAVQGMNKGYLIKTDDLNVLMFFFNFLKYFISVGLCLFIIMDSLWPHIYSISDPNSIP